MKKYITGGFIAPTPAIKEGYPDLVVEKSYAEMQECGLDYMISISFGEKDFPEHYKKQFEYAEKFDDKVSHQYTMRCIHTLMKDINKLYFGNEEKRQ